MEHVHPVPKEQPIYRYTTEGRLRCQWCDDDRNVTARRCPVGVCHTLALCPNCAEDQTHYTCRRWVHTSCPSCGTTLLHGWTVCPGCLRPIAPKA